VRSHADRKPALFEGCWACPMLLRNCVAPRRAEWLQHQPRLSKLASLDPVGLHTCPTVQIASLWISPLEGKAKPRSIAFKRVIVYDDAYIRPLLPGPGELGRISLPCDRPIASFVMSDVTFGHAARHQVILTIMPDPLPAISIAIMRASEPPPLMLLPDYSAVMECDGPRCFQSLMSRSSRRIGHHHHHIVRRQAIHFMVVIGNRFVRIVANTPGM
jgi:hypothetical protein